MATKKETMGNEMVDTLNKGFKELHLPFKVMTHNGAAQAHDFNRGISRAPPSNFVFVYCKNIYNVV